MPRLFDNRWQKISARTDIETEEIGRVASQKLRTVLSGQKWRVVDEFAWLDFAERERIVGTEHHPVDTHRGGEQLKGVVAEYGRVDRESIGVARWRVRAVGPHDVAPMPGVVDPAQLCGEVASAMGEAEFEVLG